MIEYPYMICAVDVGGTKVAGALVQIDAPDKKPQVVETVRIPTQSAEGCSNLLQRIGDMIEPLIASAPLPVRAIGVGTAGHVSATDGCIAYANDIMPGWSGSPVAPYLSERFNVPVAVLNDVQSWAMGEHRWGAARGANYAIMVAAGTGLGGAIICDGKLLRGSRGFAGELGHTFHPAAANIPCTCGGMSHLESVASGSGIEALWLRDRVTEPDEAVSGKPLSGAEISQLAQEGDPLATKIIEQAGRSLGESIASWVNMLDPEIVVVGGSVTKAGPIWKSAMQNGFRSETEKAEIAVRIVDSELGDEAPLIGAAEAAKDLLEEQC